MKCKICSDSMVKIFNLKLLFKYDVDYFQCPNCKFVQTEEPYWLEEAYANALSFVDTAIMERNNAYNKDVSVLLRLLTKNGSSYLDYGGGGGVFARLMRDNGFNYYWYDKYSTNLYCQGFEGDLNDKYEAITAIEVFEHFAEPIKEIESLLQKTNLIYFSISTYSGDIPDKSWSYLFLENGQHVSIYSKETLKFIANKYGYNYVSLKGDSHIFSKKHSKLFLTFALLIAKVSRHTGLWRLFRKPSLAKSDKTMLIAKHTINSNQTDHKKD